MRSGKFWSEFQHEVKVPSAGGMARTEIFGLLDKFDYSGIPKKWTACFHLKVASHWSRVHLEVLVLPWPRR